MKFHATLRFIRIGPRKARYVIDLIRRKPVNDALEVLRTVEKRAAYLITKILKSAIANASQGETKFNINDLIVTEARVDGGPMLKRFRPGPMGRAMRIRRRMSHIHITVEPKLATQPSEEPKKDKPAADKAETKQ